MTTCKPVPAAKTSRRIGSDRQDRQEVRPAVPDSQIWKTDKARAFEAGVRWFLAVSRIA